VNNDPRVERNSGEVEEREQAKQHAKLFKAIEYGADAVGQGEFVLHHRDWAAHDFAHTRMAFGGGNTHGPTCMRLGYAIDPRTFVSDGSTGGLTLSC
jgi:hypothetical protein